MIILTKDNSGYRINFGNSHAFQELHLLCREYKFKFNPDNKGWYCSPFKLLKAYQEFIDLDEVKFSGFTLEDLEIDANPPISIKALRLKTVDEYFKRKPPLAEYQILDTKRMMNLTRVMNASEQSMGKTYVTIQTLNHLFHHGKIDRVFIVCIPEVLYNWKLEILEFGDFAKEDEILIIKADNKDQDFSNFKVVITSYNTYWLMSDLYWKINNKRKWKKIEEDRKVYFEKKKLGALEEKDIKDGPPSMPEYIKPQIDFSKFGDSRALILDESHRIKNPNSMWFRIVDIHKEYFEFRYPLSGTPHPNGIEELYAQAKIMDNSFVYNMPYTEFLATIANLGNKFSKYAINFYKEKEVSKFVDRISPFIIRRFKKDHLNLPNLNVKKIYVELSSKQRLIYEKIAKSVLFKVKEEKGNIDITEVFNRFPYILNSVINPGYYAGETLTNDQELQDLLKDWKFEDNPRVEALLSILDTIKDDLKIKKTIIWLDSPVNIEAYAEFLRSKKWKVVTVHGKSTPKGEDKDNYRARIIEEFKIDKNEILITNQVLSTGVNLQFINASIYVSRPYSLTFNLQSKDRIHRPGLIGEAHSFIIIADKTLEMSQDAVIEGRINLNNFLLKKDYMTKEDWLKIFNGKLDVFDF